MWTPPLCESTNKLEQLEQLEQLIIIFALHALAVTFGFWPIGPMPLHRKEI